MASVVESPGKTHDLILKDKPSGGNTTVNLVLQKDKFGLPRHGEDRAAVFVPRRTQGATGYTDLDPTIDLVFSQEDWSEGALAPRFEPSTGKMYASANGCDPRWANIVTLGMSKSRGWFLTRNLDAEDSSVDPWTDASGTTSRDTATKRSGDASWKVAAVGGVGISEQAYTTLDNPTIYRSKEITFRAYLQSDGTNEARIAITDSAGTTSSSSVTASSFTYASVTRTIDANATYVRIQVVTNTNASWTFYCDDGHVVPTGGIVHNGTAELGDNHYGIFGRAVCQWDETNDVWDAVYVHASATATDIKEYNGNLYVAFGSGDNAYIYGSTTSWTVSTLTGDAKYAHFFAVSRATLWKSRYDGGGDHNFMASSTNPINGGSWGSEYTVGSSDRHINRLYPFSDTVYVGKEDGLHLYLAVYEDGTSADIFVNDTPEWENNPDAENFARGRVWQKKLYLTAAQQSFFVHDGSGIDDLSGILVSPRLSDFGGRVRAIASDPIQLFLLVDTPTTDTTDAKETWLMSLRFSQGIPRLHTLEKVAIGDINGLEVNNGYLWAFGRSYVTDATDYQDSIYRWTLPTKTAAPALDASPSITTSGTFETSVIDFGLPDQDKAFIKVVVFHEDNLDAEHTIVIKCGFEGEATSTHTVGTLNSSGTVSEVFFNAASFSGGGAPEDEAVKKSVQFQFTLTTDDTVSPRIYTIAVHSLLKPLIIKTWDCYAEVQDRMRDLTGVESEDITISGSSVAATKSNVISGLETLEAQAYPIELTEDFAGLGSATTTRVQIKKGSLRRAPKEESDKQTEVWSFQLQEIAVA